MDDDKDMLRRVRIAPYLKGRVRGGVMARTTKAEWQKQLSESTSREWQQTMAVKYLATDAVPDWTETVSWREKDGRDMTVKLRAYGLMRADGGILVSVWRWHDDERAHVEATYQLHATTRAAREAATMLGRYDFADALGRLYGAHIAANRTRERVSSDTRSTPDP